METLTGYERMAQFLKRGPMDRIPAYEHFWGDTLQTWQARGILPDQDYTTHFGFDLRKAGLLNTTADPVMKPVILEETEDTYVARDGNGAVLRRHKHHDSTPEHIDFLVKDRRGWEEHIKPLVTKHDSRRINLDSYRAEKKKAQEQQQFFCMDFLAPFECIHPVCGHEHMLIGMADDPDWVRDMADTYANMVIDAMEVAVGDAGQPDGFFYYNDMGFKERPFMSPAMYRETIQPAEKRIFDYAHSMGCPVIVHSCGCVEKLIPDMLDAGMDCLQVIEVKAGMDLIKLFKNFGDRLSFMGGIDVREICTNDRNRIDAELMKKVPIVMQGNGFCVHSDHSIPVTVEYDTYRYFLDRAKEIGTYR